MRTRDRVGQFGEVFTPPPLVKAMVDLVGSESFRIESRFLEPACGSGNFLTAILDRKLSTVESRYRASEFERRQYTLLALMSLYGIELLSDNASECRQNLVNIVAAFLEASEDSREVAAAKVVVAANIVEGNALSLERRTGGTIEFPEWAYLGRGRFQRRDFRYASLAQRASYVGTLLQEADEADLFTPTRTYPPMTLSQIGELS